MSRLSPSADASDRGLVKGLNEGDESALATLYDEYGERIHDYVLSMLGDEKAAARIVHDTFIDAGRRAPRIRDHEHLGPWLYGAARRRCIRRGRARNLHWDEDGDFADALFVQCADDEPDETGELPPAEELHELLRACLAGLSPVDQEIALLAFRHGLPPARIGAVLGLPGRRAAGRTRRALATMEAVLADERGRAARGCASRPRAAAEPQERPGAAVPAAAHSGDCADCGRRGRVHAAALLARAPAPVLPAALRHRVMHTATDPELAAHRADIAARGGALTPDGLPIQPDVPSPFTRRWLFTGGGMAGALVAALVAVVAIGPGVGSGTLSWPPFQTEPQPSITSPSPSPGKDDGGGPSGAGGGPAGTPSGGVPAPPVRPQTRPDGSPSEQPPTSSPPERSPTPTPTPSALAPRGVLVVDPAKVEMHGTKTVNLSLAAESGPVQWTAMSSTGQLVLSEMQGSVPADGTMNVTVTLRTALIGLPGRGELTFTDSEGSTHVVEVEWGVTVL